MGNHTAGPWTTEKCKCGDDACDNWCVDPVIDFGGGVRGKANARLIAAAPDMLAALENIAGRMRYHLDCGGVVEANEILIACDIAIRAIEKARGV